MERFINVFSDLWGWWPNYSSHSWDTVKVFLRIDATKTLTELRRDYVLASLNRHSYGPGGFYVFGRALIQSGDVEGAQRLYEEMLRLCQAMFRSFPQPVAKYDWLGSAQKRADPALPRRSEHEVLLRRLLIPELDVHQFALAAIHQALDWLPELASSMIEVLPQLETAHSRTGVLTILSNVDLTDELRHGITTGLAREDRLPVLLEARSLGVQLASPALTPIFFVSTPHSLEDRIWRAMMPLAQKEFRGVAEILGDDPDELLGFFVHRIANSSWNEGHVLNRMHRYVHPNFAQIPHESFELQLMMDELYRHAAARFPELSSAERKQVEVLIRHDDHELIAPSFSCSPVPSRALPPYSTTIVPIESSEGRWVPLAMHRVDHSEAPNVMAQSEMTFTWLATTRQRSHVPKDFAMKLLALSPNERLRLADVRSWPARGFSAWDAQPALVGLHHNMSLTTGETAMFVLNPLARERMDLQWTGNGLDLRRGRETVVRYYRWRTGFDAARFRRRWQDEGAILLVHEDLIPDIDHWLGRTGLLAAASTRRVTVDSGGRLPDEAPPWTTTHHPLSPV